MCRVMPKVFRTGTLQSKPAQTIEQWAAAQTGFYAQTAQTVADPLTSRQIKLQQLKAVAA